MADENPENRPDLAEAARKEARRRAIEEDATPPDDERRAEDLPPNSGERPSRLYRFGRRLLDRGDDVRELASSVLESSDRAKTEMVRMVAREVRTYLDELKLKDDVKELLTEHSLEVKMSFHLRPLTKRRSDDEDDPKGDG